MLIGGPEEFGMEGALAEFVAERDEEVLEAYLEGKLTGEMGLETLQNLIRQRRAFIAMAGSALRDSGIGEFWQVFDRLTATDYRPRETFSGLVYKVRRDAGGAGSPLSRWNRGRFGHGMNSSLWEMMGSRCGRR